MVGRLTRHGLAAGLLVWVACGVACGDGDKAARKGFPAASLGCLKKADLKVEDVKTADAEAYGATACVKGALRGLKLLLCKQRKATL